MFNKKTTANTETKPAKTLKNTGSAKNTGSVKNAGSAKNTGSAKSTNSANNAKAANYAKSSKPSKASTPSKAAKVTKAAVLAVTPNWLYLSDKEVTARDLYQALDPETNPELQLWADAGILEIPVAEKASVDIEEMECDLGDEIGNAYLAENQIRTVMMVTIVPAAWEESRAVMLSITQKCGGFFCGDTDDFTPQIR